MLTRKFVLSMLSVAVVISFAACATDGFNPDENIDVAFSAQNGVPPPGAYVPGEILIQFEANATDTQKGAARAQIGASIKERILTAPMKASGEGELELVLLPNGLTVAAALTGLEGVPGVNFAEPNYIYTHDATCTDPYYTVGYLWGVYGDASPLFTNAYGSQAAEAWLNDYISSNDVFVGIIDEGIQLTHRDLSDHIWVNPHEIAGNGVDDDGNGYIDDVNGWDFVNNDNTIYDGTDDDHGTHVAGTIGAVPNNGIGLAGVAWNVKMISAKFLGTNGGTTANAVKAVDYTTDLKLRHGMDIVATNNSWGGGWYSTSLYKAIQRAGNADILFVAAAGNDGRNNDSSFWKHYPSSYNNDNIIAVAAIASDGSMASWSNYGKKTVDIGAPGVGILSTVPTGRYVYYSGTSMATPHVTGAAVVHASSSGQRGLALKDAILNAAAPTSSLSGKCVTGGRLDMSNL